MPISYKQEFVMSLGGGNGDRHDDPPGYRAPHRKRYPEGYPLPPSSAEMLRERGPGKKPGPVRDAKGRFTGRRVG